MKSQAKSKWSSLIVIRKRIIVVSWDDPQLPEEEGEKEAQAVLEASSNGTLRSQRCPVLDITSYIDVLGGVSGQREVKTQLTRMLIIFFSKDTSLIGDDVFNIPGNKFWAEQKRGKVQAYIKRREGTSKKLKSICYYYYYK